MSDTVLVAIVSAVSALLLVFANAWAKRLSKSTVETPENISAPGDTTLNDIGRINRTLGETLHDETRAVMRRGFADIHDRLDVLERHRREDMEEWRQVMKPSGFQALFEAVDRVAPKG